MTNGKLEAGKLACFLAEQNDHILINPNFPLSSKYNPDWVFENEMGPNALWLTEWLTREMDLKPGMKILDMGCGKALSSMFLANEFGVDVWATDLWIPASENWQRVKDAGMEDKVFPIHAEAHALPYADKFFDAIVSMTSYEYYGTDDLYLGYFQKFLKPGGQIGIVIPGLHKEFENGIPEYFTTKKQDGRVFWEWQEAGLNHTGKWWKSHWSHCPFMDNIKSDVMEDGGNLWLKWEQAYDKSGSKRMFPSDADTFKTDNNQYLTFIRVIAEKKG